jgi:hypothetical protein
VDYKSGSVSTKTQGNTELSFKLRNTGGTQVTITAASVENTDDNTDSYKRMRIGGSKALANSAGPYDADGSEYDFASNSGSDMTFSGGGEQEVVIEDLNIPTSQVHTTQKSQADYVVKVRFSDTSVKEVYLQDN